MLIDIHCPFCGESMQFDNSQESMFCPYCGGNIPNGFDDSEEIEEPRKPKRKRKKTVSNDSNLYISYNSTDPGVGMVTRIVATGVKNTYINGQTLSFHLVPGSHTIVLKIGRKNYNRDIVIPSDNSPVRIYASYNGRAHISIDQPPAANNYAVADDEYEDDEEFDNENAVQNTMQNNSSANGSDNNQSLKDIIIGIIGFIFLVMIVKGCIFG